MLLSVAVGLLMPTAAAACWHSATVEMIIPLQATVTPHRALCECSRLVPGRPPGLVPESRRMPWCRPYSGLVWAGQVMEAPV